MGFFKYNPIKAQSVHDIETTNALEKQLWQEIVMIRYLDGQVGISEGEEISPFIDQAKAYFLDAFHSDWRSAGLLYYYSFLNLAKAFVAAKGAVTVEELRSTSSYHGLSTDPQDPSTITDFEMSIHPPSSNGQRNIFSMFYESLVGETWPCSRPITIKLSKVLPYCREVSREIENFYGITPCIIDAQSLGRTDGSNYWFDLNIRTSNVNIIQSHIGKVALSVVNPSSFTIEDQQDWLFAYQRDFTSMYGTSFLRTERFPYTQANKNQVRAGMCKIVCDAFSQYSCSLPICSVVGREFWQFIPKISLGEYSVKWHPLLSDYLIAFTLSTILRYNPHLLKEKDSFFAEAWCAQSPIIFLRYFLMELSTPPIRYS